MDAHFSEYLAAIEAIQEIYGERADSELSEFHQNPLEQIGAESPLEPAGV